MIIKKLYNIILLEMNIIVYEIKYLYNNNNNIKKVQIQSQFMLTQI